MPALLETYPAFPFVLERGELDRVYSEDGATFYDFYGGHCVTLTGHSHPKVVAAIAAQAKTLLFYSAAARLRVRERAADALIAFVGTAGVASVFFCNSGAEANENALKLAIRQTGRSSILSFDGGWHGRTLLALSATDDPKITDAYASVLAPHQRITFGDRATLDDLDLSQFAAVIVEPIQSMSGIRVAPREWYQRLHERARAAGCWLIFDEIQTGLGRLGAPTAAEFFGVQPDAITFAKGLASGVPIGALTLSAEKADAVKPGDLGSTFGGGPLAMAAMLATLAVVNEEGLVVHAALAGARLKRSLPGGVVSEVLGAGLLLGLRTHAPAAELKKFLYERGILVGASSDPNVLRLMPCLNVSDAALDALEAAVHEFATA